MWIKLAIFAGIHGDEPAGVHALCDLVNALDGVPMMGRQYLIHVFPRRNPTGYEDGSRDSWSGKDLNREFWRGSSEPEVQLLEREILKERYDGFISLHSDDTSDGLYGFVRGATLTEHLLKPALAAAENALPVNRSAVIDGFHAVHGIIHSAYDGILSGPPDTKPAPVEIILESPGHGSAAVAARHLRPGTRRDHSPLPPNDGARSGPLKVNADSSASYSTSLSLTTVTSGDVR